MVPYLWLSTWSGILTEGTPITGARQGRVRNPFFPVYKAARRRRGCSALTKFCDYDGFCKVEFLHSKIALLDPAFHFRENRSRDSVLHLWLVGNPEVS